LKPMLIRNTASGYSNATVKQCKVKNTHQIYFEKVGSGFRGGINFGWTGCECTTPIKVQAVNVGRYGVVVHKMVQEQRDMMVVFPHAYHAGFNHGFNMAEAVNFALPR
jgi:hypothetical protein